MQRFSTAVRLVVGLVCVATGGHAQERTGTLSGVVRDPSGSVIQSAVIEAREVRTGFARSARTGEHGVYTLVQLPVGIYSVRATKTGFQSLVREGVRLTDKRYKR